MTIPVATPLEVREHSNLTLSDGEIDPYLDDAAWRLAQHTDVDTLDTALRKRLERWLAEHEILTIREGQRSVGKETLGDLSQEYEQDRIATLEDRIHQYDPTGGELLGDAATTTIDVDVVEGR